MKATDTICGQLHGSRVWTGSESTERRVGAGKAFDFGPATCIWNQACTSGVHRYDDLDACVGVRVAVWECRD